MSLNNIVLNIMVGWVFLDAVVILISWLLDIDWSQRSGFTRNTVTVILLPMIGWMAFVELVDGLIIDEFRGGDDR